MFVYFLYVIGTWMIYRLCVVANTVALVFKSEMCIRRYGIYIYMVYMAGSKTSAGISTTNLGYY